MTAAQGAGSAIRSVCAGEQTRYKILDAGNATGAWPAPWRPPSKTRSMTRATFSRTNLKVRNTTHVTVDRLARVQMRQPHTSEHAEHDDDIEVGQREE